MTWNPNPKTTSPLRNLAKKPPGLKTRKRDKDEVIYRHFELDYRLADNDARTVPAVLSTESPVKRWFGNEVLRHTEDAIDLARAAEGLPLLWNHDSDRFLGVVRNVRLDGGQLRGDLHFSAHNAEAADKWPDVASGMLRGVSIGYRIEQAREDADGNIEATRWSIAEASIVPMPADIAAGTNRSEAEEEPAMTTTKSTGGEAREAEKARTAGIVELFADWQEPRHVELMGRMLKEGASVDDARGELLALLGKDQLPASQAAPIEEKRNVEDACQRMEESLAVRFGIETDSDAIEHCRRKNEFGGLTIVEMAREWLRLAGHNYSGPASEIVTRVMNPNIMQTRATAVTGDFPEILANVAMKSLLKAYWDAPETWRTWCSTSSVQDFKENHRVNLSEFDTLPVVAEGANYTEGTFTDLGERITLATYGMNYSITREALINDDISAFTRIPTAMGLSAARTIGNLAYGVLTSNPVMNQDSTTLFHATHNNDVPVGAGGDKPTADTVQAGKVAMALQKGPKGEATLGIMPRYLIVPVELEGVANTLMAAQYNPASTAGTLEPNVVQQLCTVVSDHRLSTADVDMWYMAADPARWDTIDLAFLNGNQQPYQERRNDSITNDNITYKVRIDAAAAPMDFRGVYRNAGKAV